MKSLFSKITATILLVLSVVFCDLAIVPAPVFAEEDDFVPGTSEERVDPIENPDTTPKDDSEDNTTQNPDDSTDDEEFIPGVSTQPVDPIENPDTTPDETTDGNDEDAESTNICTEEAGNLGWIICPSTGVIAKITDQLYNLISDFLVVEPLTMDGTSPIYQVWKYARSLTNIVFVIFLVIIIYSQLTGLGLNNYSVKRTLPRLIITVILVNLSFLICSLAVDVSNILGASLRNTFVSIQESLITSGVDLASANISISSVLTAVVSGGTIAGFVISATGASFWMLVPLLVSGLIAVATGLITVATRQAVIALLIMIAPLAFVLYLLPNTEKWFTQWKNLLTRMLVFFPMFSLLFGASQLTGLALIASASNSFGIILGVAVQILPLFLSWSLMKMSGTFLSTINSGLRKALSPLQRATSSYANEHAEQFRQNHISKSEASGARLRRYLDSRRALRLEDTKNSTDIRTNRALERAYTTMSSIVGRDDQGNTVWTKTPNRYARNAKTASYYATLSSTASLAHKNTMTAYGRHFEDKMAQSISDQHAEAFLDSMAQQFLATNEAQADQDYLLSRYLGAKKNLVNNTYEYNRLIKGAAGGLGHTGETSIMGQVIVGNSTIENRRRTEGRIMINKFGMEKHKQELRGMAFDIDKMNDNGYEVDEYNNPIEDDQYNLLPSKAHTPWQRYIAVNAHGKEITKEEYDALSEEERRKWTKVRYFDITDDAGNHVQRVFEDDAGYMKELLADDVFIADPIVRRFTTQIGVAQNENEKDGILRRYHSTIRTAVDNSGFKKGHGAGYTQMYTSTANAGLIRNMTHHNILLLQSFSASSKPGDFAQQDAFFIEELENLMATAKNPELFSHYFTDEGIQTATTNNGVPINGLKLVYDKDTKQPKWEEVNYRDLEQLDHSPLEEDRKEALECRKNYIKHKVIPKAIATAFSDLERKLSPEAVNSLKPGAKKALDKLRNELSDIVIMNLDESIPFTERPDGNNNLAAVPDTNSMNQGVKETQRYIKETYGQVSAERPSVTTIGQSARNSINSFNQKLQRSQEADERIRKHEDTMEILNTFEEYYMNAKNGGSLHIFCQDIAALFSERRILSEWRDECNRILQEYLTIINTDFIRSITDFNAESEQIDNLYAEISNLLYTIVNQS